MFPSFLNNSAKRITAFHDLLNVLPPFVSLFSFQKDNRKEGDDKLCTNSYKRTLTLSVHRLGLHNPGKQPRNKSTRFGRKPRFLGRLESRDQGNFITNLREPPFIPIFSSSRAIPSPPLSPLDKLATGIPRVPFRPNKIKSLGGGGRAEIFNENCTLRRFQGVNYKLWPLIRQRYAACIYHSVERTWRRKRGEREGDLSNFLADINNFNFELFCEF